MGAALVAKDDRLPARSVAVVDQPSSLLPELTGIALALEGYLGEEDLNNVNILTDSLSSMQLLRSMQRGYFGITSLCHSIDAQHDSFWCMWSSYLTGARGWDTLCASLRFVHTEESS